MGLQDRQCCLVKHTVQQLIISSLCRYQHVDWRIRHNWGCNNRQVQKLHGFCCD
jgi:hypothetical protein